MTLNSDIAYFSFEFCVKNFLFRTLHAYTLLVSFFTTLNTDPKLPTPISSIIVNDLKFTESSSGSVDPAVVKEAPHILGDGGGYGIASKLKLEDRC